MLCGWRFSHARSPTISARRAGSGLLSKIHPRTVCCFALARVLRPWPADPFASVLGQLEISTRGDETEPHSGRLWLCRIRMIDSVREQSQFVQGRRQQEQESRRETSKRPL